MSTLVLFSGGMDSTVALFWAMRMCPSPTHALTFDYGQRHRREIGSALSIWSFVLRLSRNTESQNGYVPGFHDVVPIQTALGGALVGKGAVKQYDQVPTEEEARSDPAFVPYRNLIFLAHAAAFARNYKCHTIVTGLRGGFPDCTDQFEQRFLNAAAVADPSWSLEIKSPMRTRRATGVHLAQELPHCIEALAMSWTCFAGGEEPCGKCLPCIKRAEGFAEVGILDPALDPALRQVELP